MSLNLNEQVARKIAAFQSSVESILPTWTNARTPAEFREVELAAAAECRALADELTGIVLKSIVADVEFQTEVSVAARQDGKLRLGARRGVTVTLLGGSQVHLENLEYLKPNHRRRRRGRPRSKRGPGGSGVYPCLAALGICFGVTSALACEICAQVADSDSVRAGRAALGRRGIDLGHKQTLRIVNAFSARAVAQREQWLQEARESRPTKGILAGKRVVVATDGGRIRERVRHVGRRRKNGHHGFDAPWREPKLLVIYVVDAKGRVEQEFRPIYDGTLGDCDAVFAMLVGYLRAMGAHQAKQLMILGDGAKWIWDRAPELAAKVGIDPSKLVEVVDYYHAAETLHDIAGIPSDWKTGEKRKWLRTAKRLLYDGKTADLVDHIRSIAKGRRAKKISSHIDYFERNEHRMQYRSFAARHIPRGSGAVESAMRRIINLRMKSNAKFWNECNAEGMILLRSYLKAGRFDDLVDWSTAQAATWHPQYAASTPIADA